MSDSASNQWPAGAGILLRGQRWTVLSQSDFDDCRVLRVVGSDDVQSIVRTFLLPFDRPRRIDSAPLTVVRPRRWLRIVQRAALDARPIGGLFPAAGGALDLHPYQMEPALAMLREGHLRILIADAVGLGKTIQAGLIVRQLVSQVDSCRVLVVVPASLRDQWAEELRTRFEVKGSIATASWLARTARDLPADVSPWSLPGVFICSFEFIRQPEVLRPLEETCWDLLIVDEAHAATAATARRAAVHAAALRSRRVVLLTATPHSGDDDQFRALCGIGDSDVRPNSILLFQRSRHDAGMPNRRRTVLLGITISPSEHRTHQLLERYTSALHVESRASGNSQTRLLAIILRKRALSSVSTLAVSCARRLALLERGDAITPAEQLQLPLDDDDSLNDDELSDTILGVAGLANGDRERRQLRSIIDAAENLGCEESKVTRLKRFLRRTNEPAIVFTEYRDTLTLLRDKLRTSYPEAYLLHGGMTTTERARTRQQFNENGGLLLATDAASEGLNLQRQCRIVIHFELPWSPARLEQRTGRVDRLGQSRTVHEILLVASDTAERLVLAPLARRVARARTLTADRSRLLEILSESRVASAIMDGASLDLESAFPAVDTLRPPAVVSSAGQLEVQRIAQLRKWRAGAVSTTGGVAAVAIKATERLRPGILRLYTLTLTAESGAIVHTEVVAAHEPCSVERSRTPDDVRRVIAALESQHAAAASEVLRLIQSRLDGILASCAQLATALIDREAVVSTPALSSAQQLVQRGLFDRRVERAAHHRVQADAAVVLDAARRVNVLKGWVHATPSLKLNAMMLISDARTS